MKRNSTRQILVPAATFLLLMLLALGTGTSHAQEASIRSLTAPRSAPAGQVALNCQGSLGGYQLQIDQAHSSIGSSEVICNYTAQGQANPPTTSGFAITVDYFCPADAQSAWQSKTGAAQPAWDPQNNPNGRIGPQGGNSLLIREDGAVSGFAGNFTVTEKLFLFIDPQTIATVVVHTDVKQATPPDPGVLNLDANATAPLAGTIAGAHHALVNGLNCSGSSSPTSAPAAVGGNPSQTASCSPVLETLTVSSHAPTPYSSKTVLANGQNYTVVVSGIVSLYPNANTGYDALYDYRTPNNPILFQNGDSLVYLNDQPLAYWINLTGGSTAYRDDHTYSASIPGTGQPLAYHFHEGGSYDDNSGDLTIQLCPGGNAPTGMVLEAPRRLALPGATLLIPVWLKNAANVANLNFDLGYDSKVIQVQGTPVKGDLLDNALFSVNASTAGLMRVGFAQTNGLSGSGTVLNVQVRITGKPGDKTPLALRVTTINDPSGSVLNVMQISGEIDVTNPDGTLPGGGGGSCQQQLETLTVSSRTAATVTSKTVLAAGQPYTVIASGVVGLFPNTNTGFDALYDYRKPGQEGRVTVDAPENNSMLVVNGQWLADLITASGGSIAYRSDHTYAATLAGNGQPLTAKFSDWGSYDDNAGALNIKLCAGGSGNNGGGKGAAIPRGDCDGDLKLTELDALCALEMSVELRPVQLIMDMDGDGRVTSRDAVIILQSAVGK
ncbi:MAG: cohesin domain-containing protein [Anaerolineae bacterium]